MVETHGTDGRRMAGNVTRIGERMVIEGKVTGGENGGAKIDHSAAV